MMIDRAPYWALQLWCVQVAGAFYAVAVASRLFGNPLAIVIDVVLPLQMFLPLPIVATFAVRSAISQTFSEQSRPIITILSCVFSSCAAMVGYAGFAYLFDLGSASDSTVFATISDAIDSPVLTAVKFLHDHHIAYADALSFEGRSLAPLTIIATMSLVFALLSAGATIGRDLSKP